MKIPLIDHHEFDALTEDFTVFEKEVAVSLRDKGYAVIDFPDPDFDEHAASIISDLSEVLRQPGDADAGERRSVRVQDRDHSSVKSLAGNKEIINLLSKVYGKRAFPFQTLNFSLGTQQPIHSDDVHFSSYPKGFMCGVWVALEDIHPDAGPLEFYPGSHHLQNIDGINLGQHPFENPTAQPDVFGEGIQNPLQSLWHDALETSKIKPDQFIAKRGQALIWVYNLLHGGSHQKDLGRTRWSQVTHYYFEGCDYYTPVSSEYGDGKLAYRDNVTDLRDHKLMSAKPTPVLPSDFDGERYLQLHADVAADGADPVHHWMHHGFFEGRRYK